MFALETVGVPASLFPAVIIYQVKPVWKPALRFARQYFTSKLRVDHLNARSLFLSRAAV
jgi:hypothetical protein